jgi:hypothetical protein
MAHQYHVKTPNFSYILNIKEQTSPFHTIEFTVGGSQESQKPYLEASLFLPDNDSRVQSIINTCTLHKIDAIERCALEYDEDKSFGTELLYSFINIVTVNYPHITTIKLDDASYIPCNRADGDTLDLLTYSIALYGKTWYEIKAGARLPSDTQRDLYEKNIKKFIDPETKSNIPFSEMLSHMLSTSTGREFIGNNIPTYETMYEQSKTLPEFFTTLSKKIPKHMKCKFFKGWLEYFIGLHVFIGRDWLINIRQNSVLQNLNVLNASKSKPIRSKTRKCKR